MGSKKLQIWLPLLLSVMMVAGMSIGYELRDKTGANSFLKLSKKSSLQEVMDLIGSKYVDNIKIDSVNQVAITEVLSHLDPHSVYIPASNVKEVNEDLMGNFQGIGIEFQLFNDTLNVVNVIKDGPSDKAGLQIGDEIIKVSDTINLTGRNIKHEEVRTILRGIAGSEVVVTILRNGNTKKIAIKRGNISISSIDAAYIIAPQTGYIRINKFGERTYEEFMQSLESLLAKGMNKLMLDLRGNGGGLVSEATAIADEFLSGDKLIVYTEGEKSTRYDYKSKRDGLFENGKLVVLVDETSASASEILSGALQDWDRATIVGRRTFGKGLVQQQFQLSDGSALRLTIARYYTPLGRNIQKPYVNKSKRDYEEEFIDRFQNGEVVHGDTAKQKGKAFKTPQGHLVYGGGGITPDVFVPYDTTRLHNETSHLYYKNTLSNFVYKYYIQNSSRFKTIHSATELQQKFNFNQLDWQNFVAFATKDTVNLQNISLSEKEDISKKIKALMGRQLFRNEGYFEISNNIDILVNKALEAIK